MSGGKSGIKSEETRKKISIKKKENWANPEIAKRMRKGLESATQEWQRICEENRIVKICPYCGKEFKVQPSESEKRKYCSRVCSAKATSDLRVSASTKSIKEEAKNRHEKFLQALHNWCLSNRDIIHNCPMNKISTNLQPIQQIASQYGFKDWRIITQIICNSSSRKEMLNYLKSKY